MIDKRFFSPLEISQYLGLKPDTIYSWVWQKKIPYHKFGRLVKFDIREIEEWAKRKHIKEMN
jgi:excisionase family DNA binding protein